MEGCGTDQPSERTSMRALVVMATAPKATMPPWECPEHIHGLPGGRHGIHHSGDVLNTPAAGGIRERRPGTSASPVECMNRNVRLQVGHQRAPERMVAGRAVDPHNRRPGTHSSK